MARTCVRAARSRDTVLRRDLDCRETGVSFGLRVQGPATLDLGGHSVNCRDDRIGACIVLIGEGAGLKSGSAFIEFGPAVVVAGDGGHKVRDVRVLSGEFEGFEVVSDGNHLERNDGDGNPGFLVTGDANILDGNTDISREVASFLIEGADNLLTRNTALPSADTPPGFVVEGPSNRLINNSVRPQEDPREEGIRLGEWAASTTVLGNAIVGAMVGITVDSDRNLIVANEARDNEGDGIRLAAGAESNVVLGNQAGGNGGFDLFDENPGCDANLWVANQFDDVNQACAALSLR